MIDHEVVPYLLAPTNLRVYRKEKKVIFDFNQTPLNPALDDRPFLGYMGMMGREGPEFLNFLFKSW